LRYQHIIAVLVFNHRVCQRSKKVRFSYLSPESRRSAFVKSFGRWKRTKVLEEGTRGEQAQAYGEYYF
jgi:hypothetical protein